MIHEKACSNLVHVHSFEGAISYPIINTYCRVFLGGWNEWEESSLSRKMNNPYRYQETLPANVVPSKKSTLAKK